MIRERAASFAYGMNDSATSADDFRTQQCALILNGRVDFDGSAAAVGGSRILHADSPVADYGRGITVFQPTSGARQLVRFLESGGATIAAYSTDSGATWTNMATGLPAGDWSLTTMTVAGVTYLLGAVGGATMYSWNGSAWGGVAGPVTGIKYIEVFNERLYASDGKLVYGSEVADFATWAPPDGVVLPIQTHDAAPITNIAAAGTVLLVQKRDSTAYVDGFGNTDIIVASGSRGISRSVGCIAHRTFCPVGNGYAWLSDRGVEFWGGPGSDIKPVAQGVRNYFLTMAKNRITDTTGTGSTDSLPCAVYWPFRKEYWIAWPSAAYRDTSVPVVNDEGLIVSMVNDETPTAIRRWNPPANEGRAFYPGAMCVAEITVGEEGRSYHHPVILTKAGDALLSEYGHDEMVASDGSGGHLIDFRVRTRDFDFKEPTRRKWARLIRVAGIPPAWLYPVVEDGIWTGATTESGAGGFTDDGGLLAVEDDEEEYTGVLSLERLSYLEDTRTVSVFLIADGVEGNEKVADFSQSQPETPQPKILRVSGRGLNLQVEVRASGGFRLSGLELHAHMMTGVL